MPGPVASIYHPRRDNFGYVMSLAWGPGGDVLATGDCFGVVRLWNTGTWELVAELFAPSLEMGEEIQGLWFSPRRERLIALHSHRVTAWDVASRSLLWQVSGPGADGRYCSPRCCDLYVEVVLCEGLRLLDAITGKWIREEFTRFDDTPVGITSDRALFVTSPDSTEPLALNHTLVGRDVRTLKVKEEFVIPLAPDSPSVAIKRNTTPPEGLLDGEAAFGWHYLRQAQGGDAMILSAYDGNSYLVDIGRRPWRFIQAIPRRLITWSADWRRMAMLPDVHTHSKDWTEIELFNASLAKGMKESIGKIEKPEDVGYIVDAAFSPDNRLLAIAPNGPTVHVFAVDL